MYDTVKGSDWLGDQDAIEYLCKNAPAAVYELEHWGVPFSRTEEGKIYQRPFGGMTTDYGKGTAQRTCAAADRTGHAILHTLYGNALKHQTEFFIEFFAIDLIMSEEGRCLGVVCLKMDDGTIHRFQAQQTILATGGYGRAYFSATSAHTCTGDGNAMVLRAGLPLEDMEFVQFHPTGIYGAGCLITEGSRGEGGYLTKLRGRALHGALCALREGPCVPRRRLPRHDHGDPRGPRRRQEQGPHLSAPRPSGSQDPGRAPAGHFRKRQDLRRRRRDAEPIPVIPTVHYNMGGIPTNYHGEVLTKVGGDPDHVVPGLMAIGEAACVSVHGANRLGSNSLIDWWSSAAPRACAAGKRWRRAPAGEAAGRFRGPRASPGSTGSAIAKGGTPTAKLRAEMQATMQSDCAVYRTGKTLLEGKAKINQVWKASDDTPSPTAR